MGALKLNFDGAFKGNLSLAKFSCVIRDCGSKINQVVGAPLVFVTKLRWKPLAFSWDRVKSRVWNFGVVIRKGSNGCHYLGYGKRGMPLGSLLTLCMRLRTYDLN